MSSRTSLRNRGFSVLAFLSLGALIFTSSTGWADEYADMRATMVGLILGNNSSGTPLYTNPPPTGSPLAQKFSSLEYAVTSNPTATTLPVSSGVGYWDLMNLDPSAAYLWPDLQFTNADDLVNTRNITYSYNRLLAMAIVYYSPGCVNLHGNTALKNAITSGLEWLYAHKYNENVTPLYGNWFDWEIGTPKTLTKILLLMDYAGDLSPTDKTHFTTAIDHYVPYPTAQTVLNPPAKAGAPTMTGANLLDQATVVAFEGIEEGTSSKIGPATSSYSASWALSQVLPYVNPTTATASGRDGFYKDGSFIQHSGSLATTPPGDPYIGGYGMAVMSDVGTLMYLLNSPAANSTISFAVTDPNQWNAFCWVFDSVAPFVYHDNLMDGVVGRNISFGPSLGPKLYNPAVNGAPMLTTLDYFVQIAPTTNASLSAATGRQYPTNPKLGIQQLMKYWVTTDDNADTGTTSQILNYASIGQYVDIESWLASTSAAAAPTFYQQFPSQDRVVQMRPVSLAVLPEGYAFEVSMTSTRTNNYESGAGNGVKSWYTGDGMTYLYNNDPLAYYRFWTTVDSYRLPGTTVDTQTRSLAADFQNYTPHTTWVGGVEMPDLTNTVSSTNVYGVTGMDYAPPGDIVSSTNGQLGVVTTPTNLVAKKSWFFFDDEMVALGAGITATDQTGLGHDGVTARRTETIVDNRKLDPVGTNSMTVGTLSGSASGSFAASTANNWASTVSNVSWIYLQGATASEASSVGYYFPGTATVDMLRSANTGDYTQINTQYLHTLTVSPAGDTYIQPGQGTATNGAMTTMWVKNDAGNFWRASVLDYYLANYVQDTNSTVATATAYLNAVAVGTTTNSIVHRAALTATTSWTEQSLTYTSSPSVLPFTDLSPIQQWYPTGGTVSFDATPAASSALASAPQKLSFGIYATSTFDSNSVVQYGTKESATYSARPYLVLDGYKEPSTATYATFWFDHGPNPTGATYSYVVLPGMSSASVSSYAANPDVEVVENDTTVQAVREKNWNIVGANFWNDGAYQTLTVGGQMFLKVDHKASVMTQEEGDKLQIAISDPTQLNTGTISVIVNRIASTAISLDPNITVASYSPVIMLTVSVSGQAGKTFHASFNTPPQTFLASEDSYTYDATTSANTNFGTSTVAMVKADAAGFNRKSYFKFNLGTYSSAVKSANVTLTAIGSPGATTTEQANEVTSAWTEGGITWNNSPSVSSTVLSTWSVPVLTGTSTFSFDVTPAIQDAMTAGTATPSVQVSGATSGSLNIVQYATRETTATASRPVLTIHQN